MNLDRGYALFLAFLVVGLSAAAFPGINITGMFSESPLTGSNVPDHQKEFVDRMYGSGMSAASSSQEANIQSVNGKIYAYPKGVNVSKFDEEIFYTGLAEKDLYSDMDSFNIILNLDTELGSDSKQELPAEILDLEQKGLIGIKNVLKSSDSVAIKIVSQPGEVFRAQNNLGSVKKGTLDTRVRALNLDANGVVGAGDARQSYNINGSGEILAVLDTGVEASHLDYSSRVVGQKDYSGDGTGDGNGHGTHVSGTVLGDGSADGGYYPGMSQQASLLSVKVLGDNGYGSTSDIQAGIEYAADNNASVISLSIGGPNSEFDITNYNSSVQYARNKGSVVVVAAGNDGNYETINVPGSVPDVITVGAVDDGESLASFSSKGPEDVYFNIKPEVTAPGKWLVSASNDYPSTNYTTKSGTSMATPVVSGVIGLMREKNPGWMLEEVENAIIASGEGNKIGDGKNVFERGTGVINATKAVDPQLKLSETRFNLGNISALQKHSKTITLQNPTGEQRNYSTSSEIHMYDRASQSVQSGDNASISFNQSNVVVPAGGSRDIQMYLEINEEYSEPYGGIARFEDEESYAIIVGGYTNNASQLTADISLNSSTIDINDSVEADGSGSNDPEGSIQSYSWDMGDNTSLSGNTVTHSYDSTGDYTIQLTVEDNDTNQATETSTVTVKDLQDPQASFTVNDSSPEASISTVEFDSSSSSDNLDISHYLWDLDGDSSYDKNTSSTTVEKGYSTVGTRTVKLKVVDTSGNSDTSTKDIDVEDTTSPDVQISLNSTNITIGEDVEMDGSSSTDNTGINSYSWNYGSSTASSSTVIDSFSSPGLYSVELNVSDSYGNYNSTTEALNVSDETSPVGSIAIANKISELGTDVNFSASQSTDNVGINDYRWDVNNDSSFDKTGVNISKKMDSPGNYSIGLEVEDGSNNTDFVSTWFYVNDTESPQIDLDI
ncbi:MAG: S8 family serine peptidase, partial [Candidatus Nanohaloarchaea archaeon]